MKYVLLIFLLPVYEFVNAQKKTYNRYTDTLADGVVAYKWVKITEPKKFDLHNYYKITETTTKYIGKSGVVFCEQLIIQRIGADALPCRELLFLQKDYHANGKLKSYWKVKCDCHKVWKREYNSKGQLLNKSNSVIKRYY